jgi:hypothetical protein
LKSEKRESIPSRVPTGHKVLQYHLPLYPARKIIRTRKAKENRTGGQEKILTGTE